MPASHAPGASGFLVQYEDGPEQHHLLATRDWTTGRVAGYPGLDMELPVDVETVFLTAATGPDTGDDPLTEVIKTICARAGAGSTVLTTASALTGIHLAYLLAHLNDTSEVSLPVTLVGRAATLWDTFGYDHPTVNVIPEFAEPETVVGPGRITIAGPEVPVAGSARRLFKHLSADGGATLVQVTSGAFEPQSGADTRGTVYDFEIRTHPDEETIDDVVDAFDPVHVVVTHARGATADRYKDKYDSFVWATDDQQQYTLYDDGEWIGPPWVTDATRRRVLARQYAGNDRRFGDSIDTADVPIPTVSRHDDCDLAAEGLDVECLRDDERADQQIEVRHELETPPATTNGGTKAPESPDIATAEDEHSGTSQSHPSATEAKASHEEATLQEFRNRLARIEAAVESRRIRARVIDAGDGIALLRPIDESIAGELTHGDVVEIGVDSTTEPTASEND